MLVISTKAALASADQSLLPPWSHGTMSSRRQIVDSRGVLAKHCGTGWTLYTGASHTQPTCTTCTIAQRPFFNYWLQPLFFAIVLNWWSMPDKCKPQTAVNVHCTQCTHATHYQITENFLYNYQIYVSNNKSLSVTVLQSHCKECNILSLGYWAVKRLFWKCSRLAFKKPCLKKFRKIRPVK